MSITIIRENQLHECENNLGYYIKLDGNTELERAVDVMMARSKEIYILIIKVNKLFPLLVFSKRNSRNMFSVFQSSYRNTRQRLGEFKKSCENTRLGLIFLQHFSFSQLEFHCVSMTR